MTRQADTEGCGLLDFAVDRGAEVPIGVQLAWALRARIRDGRLEPGQRLPGLRELAETLEINANTVRAVYQRLEHEGIIESQRGSGTFVAADPPAQHSAAGTIAANAAREAHETGVDPREVAAALYVEVEPGARADAPDEQAERRRGLRTQIAALEQALAEREVAHPGVLAPPGAVRARRGPRLLSVAELEQVQTHLVRRLAALQIAIDTAEAPPSKPDEPVPEEGPAPTRTSQKTSARGQRSHAKARPAPAGA
ncbi:MAG TPA: GntR family transcriptional regulator [Solirubrobacteraceae bacterium]|nr:GntR family transcriptional regulator [Solirubrobacteraceae bacterium]